MGAPWLSGVAYRSRLELVWSQALALGGLGLPGRVALGDGVPEGRLRGRVVALGRRLRVERLGGRRGPGALSRRRREALFPSGVKLCSQETLETALRNHLDYFHLRGTRL